MASSLRVVPVRFGPGVELKSELMNFVADRNLKAAFVMTCVGSLTKATLRFAEKSDGTDKQVNPFL
jgi:predicted DNA-binding protein with PD1-like motif